MQAAFNYGSNEGYYPCCEKKVLRFDTQLRAHGCQQKEHNVDSNEQ